MHRRRFLAAAAALPALAALPAAAAPRAKLIDPRWTRFGSDASGPDHGPWTAFLSRWRRMGADGVARLDYGGARADRPALGAYIAALEAADPTALTREAAYAYWANLYNAKTVDLVLEAYPVDSIKEVRGGFFNSGPWSDKVMTVSGQSLSLDDVEHGIMRPVLRDPRIHYAVNCASIGCPNLADAAWTPATLDAELDKAARAYVNHPRGAAISGGRLTVSSIYEWFQEDFGGSDAGVIRHLAAYAEPELAAALKGIDRVADDDYDWALNDVV